MKVWSSSSFTFWVLVFSCTRSNIMLSTRRFNFCTVFSPYSALGKKIRITPRLISYMVISKITRILGQPLVGGVEGFRKEKTETKSILLFASNPTYFHFPSTKNIPNWKHELIFMHLSFFINKIKNLRQFSERYFSKNGP